MSIITVSKFRTRGLVIGAQIDYGFRYYFPEKVTWKELSFRINTVNTTYGIHIKIKRKQIDEG